jgi:hypothetical protein
MKCTKLLSIAAITFGISIMNSYAANNENYQQKNQTLKKSENPDKIIVDTLFPNISSQEKAKIQEQIAKYSQLQYGFGTAIANPSPTKDPDVLNNIKSHNPAIVKSQMNKMREAAKELPHLQKLEKSAIKL